MSSFPLNPNLKELPQLCPICKCSLRTESTDRPRSESGSQPCTQPSPVPHSVVIQFLTFIPYGPWMNPLKPPQNESDILSCPLLGTLGAMQSSSAFHGMWSMISAEGIFPFQWSLAGWPGHLEVRQADCIHFGPMRWSPSARVRFAVRRRTLWLLAHSASWRFNSRVDSSRAKAQVEAKTRVL